MAEAPLSFTGSPKNAIVAPPNGNDFKYREAPIGVGARFSHFLAPQPLRNFNVASGSNSSENLSKKRLF